MQRTHEGSRLRDQVEGAGRSELSDNGTCGIERPPGLHIFVLDQAGKFPSVQAQKAFAIRVVPLSCD